MLEQFQTCTPGMALFRPQQSARPVNASRVGEPNGRNCRSPTQSQRSIGRTVLLTVGKLVISKINVPIAFVLMERGT
jgi:hypothetical protein